MADATHGLTWWATPCLVCDWWFEASSVRAVDAKLKRHLSAGHLPKLAVDGRAYRRRTWRRRSNG